MAKMYPKDLSVYKPNDSEREVYNCLKSQLPNDFEVFYSFTWSYKDERGQMKKSEADFIVLHPNYGFLCLEVKGGTDMTIDIDSGTWHLVDSYGGRDLDESPYEQAEDSMYFLTKAFKNTNNIKFPGIYAAGVVFPFYNIPNSPFISDRNEECTIDKRDMNNLKNKIIELFNVWGRNHYKARGFSKVYYQAFVEMIKKKIAISAAAGALIELKQSQLDIINRVQDNYIFFIRNIKQFYVRGGAGTGKTWLAIKMANESATLDGDRTLCLCTSKPLAKMIRENTDNSVDVYDAYQFFKTIVDEEFELIAPFYEGIEDHIKDDVEKYDAIYIDEAQDFTEEWAYVVKTMLKEEKTSRLGVFYDDVQVLRGDSFGDAFMIETPPFLLRENIRNTSSIYDWATERTNLGTDVISNPIQGPAPKIEYINGYKQLTNRLQNLFKEYLIDEDVRNTSLIVLADDVEEFLTYYCGGIANWKFAIDILDDSNAIRVSSVEDYKGLEADMVIYIHKDGVSDNLNYVAYTRAKYYLLELVLR